MISFEKMSIYTRNEKASFISQQVTNLLRPLRQPTFVIALIFQFRPEESAEIVDVQYLSPSVGVGFGVGL